MAGAKSQEKKLVIATEAARVVLVNVIEMPPFWESS